MLCAGVEICVSEESDGGTSGQGVGALFRISQVYTMGNILKKNPEKTVYYIRSATVQHYSTLKTGLSREDGTSSRFFDCVRKNDTAAQTDR